MKKNAKDRGRKNDVDTMRREYDFSTAVRGVTAPRYAQGTNVVVIDPDVLDVFPDGVAVNEAPRAPSPLRPHQRPSSKRAPPLKPPVDPPDKLLDNFCPHAKPQ